MSVLDDVMEEMHRQPRTPTHVVVSVRDAIQLVEESAQRFLHGTPADLEDALQHLRRGVPPEQELRIMGATVVIALSGAPDGKRLYLREE